MAAPDHVEGSVRGDLFLFAGVALLYAALALATHGGPLIWDEARYVECAGNLSKGWLASEGNTDFVNGPGYPLVLWPFVAGGVSLVWARLINGVFMGLAAVLLHRTVRSYAGGGWALAAALGVAFHPNLVRLGPYLMTEPLTTFCVCAFAWAFTRAVRDADALRWPRLAVAALAFAFLIMTRVIFGHVVLVMLAAALGGMWLLPRLRVVLSRTALVCALAFALCIPYLAYTRAHTGQTLCWSTNGGELLYWMTSHHPGENGHWFSYDDATALPELAPNHREFIERVNRLPVPEREAEFAAAARRQIADSPRAVLFNWACNLSRLFFGAPRSFQAEDLAFVPVILFNVPLLLLLTAALALGVRRPASVPAEIVVLLGMAAIYLGGSSLASALPRYFMIITPLLWLFVAAVFSRNVRMTLEPRS